MSDGKTPFELMMSQAREMAKAFNPALESFSPKGFEKLWPTMPKEAMEMWFGKGISQNGLDAKTRLLLTIAGQTMQGAQAETPFRLTVRHAVEGSRCAAATMGLDAGLTQSTRNSSVRSAGYARASVLPSLTLGVSPG